MQQDKEEGAECFPVLGLAPTQVRLCAPTPQWATLYREEEARLKAVLGEMLIAVEHYGSTSIPGIQAKPILDILAGISRLADGPRLAGPLATLGYDYAGADIVPGHHIFGKGAERTHLLHIVEYGSTIWQESLRFRDALRACPALAQEYEVLKIGLSAKHADCRADYTVAKADFIERVIAGA